MKLVTVFNTCGLSGRENVNQYISGLRSLLKQERVDQRVIWSSCCNKPSDWDRVMEVFGSQISYYFTEDVRTVNMTFNHATSLAESADGYVFVDSGVNLQNRHALKKLVDTHRSGPYAMTAALTDEDDGFNLWFGLQDATKLFRNGRLEMPLGMTMNLHCQIFDRILMSVFGRILPDIFASHCTESVFTFMCAAVDRKMVVHGERVRHATGLDGPSAGFPQKDGLPGWKHLLPEARRSIEEIITDPEALACGFGYEECQKILMHDPAKYNADGSCKEPVRLGEFIYRNLFVEQHHYDKINHLFIP